MNATGTQRGNAYVLRLAGPASAPPVESNPPQWVKSFDPEFAGGRGHAVFTDKPAEALTFPTPAEAHAFWTQVPKSRPVRPDGNPNRPLTAFHIWVEPLPH